TDAPCASLAIEGLRLLEISRHAANPVEHLGHARARLRIIHLTGAGVKVIRSGQILRDQLSVPVKVPELATSRSLAVGATVLEDAQRARRIPSELLLVEQALAEEGARPQLSAAAQRLPSRAGDSVVVVVGVIVDQDPAGGEVPEATSVFDRSPS